MGNSTQGNRLGCLDNDGDGWDNSIDALPDLATQWLDQDGDGYGDNATGLQPDACPGEAGTSTTPYGCVDDDGDGYANLIDDFPNDPTRWIDSDDDGYDDAEDACPLLGGNSTQDRLGCLDSDGDGFSDLTLPVGNTSGWNVSDGADAFPHEASQAVDSDGDGFGDNAGGVEADACPSEAGTSSADRFGCVDEDGDGTSDANDAFLGEATQWTDSDGDGYGDNPNGTEADGCINTPGTSTLTRSAAWTATGMAPATPTTCGQTTPLSGLTATATATATKLRAPTVMLVPTTTERQPWVVRLVALTPTMMAGPTNRTTSQSNGVNSLTATAMATVTMPPWAPSSPIIGPTTRRGTLPKRA